MRLPILCGATVLLLATSACKTVELPKTADSACLALKRISYAIAPLNADGSRQTHDPENEFDSAETIGEISEHNVRYDAICRKDRL